MSNEGISNMFGKKKKVMLGKVMKRFPLKHNKKPKKERI